MLCRTSHSFKQQYKNTVHPPFRDKSEGKHTNKNDIILKQHIKQEEIKKLQKLN